MPTSARKGSLASGERRRGRLDHTAYRLVDVEARSGASIRLSVEVERGVRSGIALVARRGGEASGTVTAKRKYLANGGRAKVTLKSPGDYDRITAVLVNADGRVSGFDPARRLGLRPRRCFVSVSSSAAGLIQASRRALTRAQEAISDPRRARRGEGCGSESSQPARRPRARTAVGRRRLGLRRPPPGPRRSRRR